MSARRGKFETCADQDLGERLYGITLDGGCDDELGDAETFGWFALILGIDTSDPRCFIVSTDAQGFFYYDEYASPSLANNVWSHLEREYETFTENADAEEVGEDV